MRELFKTKYFKWGLTAGITLICVVLVFFLFDKAPTVHGAVGKIIGILSPFIYGIIMAYLLNPVYNWCNYNLMKILNKRSRMNDEKKTVVSSAVSVAFSIVLFLVIISALMVSVLPQLVSSIYDLVVSLPNYATRVVEWVDGVNFLSDGLKEKITAAMDSGVNYLYDWMKTSLFPHIKDVALEVSAGIMGAASVVFNIFIGVIVCIYLLLGKKKFAGQAKKAAFSVFEKDTANGVIGAFRFVDKVFSGFVSGNLIDALIVGSITGIVMSLLNWPYALLISVIVGVTNLIPFFGPFIGGGIGAILLVGEKPMTAVYFLIFILVIQQVDGNIIKPKVLGDNVNLASFWILFSIIVGGGMFGFAGMILGVPVFTVIYSFISWGLKRRLAKKNLPEHTDEYVNVDYYDVRNDTFRDLPENLYEERRRAKKEERRKNKLEKKKKKDDDGSTEEPEKDNSLNNDVQNNDLRKNDSTSVE